MRHPLFFSLKHELDDTSNSVGHIQVKRVTTIGTYSSSSVNQKFYNGQPSSYGVRIFFFEDMIYTFFKMPLLRVQPYVILSNELTQIIQ